MPCISRSDSIGASATNENVLSGNLFEFLGADSLVSFGFAQSATGLQLDISASERLLAKTLVPIIKATTPVYPDDFIVKGAPALAGERLVVSARNTTAGALTLLTVVCIDEAM